MAQEIDDKKDAPFEQSHDSERTIAISAANGGSECADAKADLRGREVRFPRRATH
jgi:hypothetical protein